MRVMWIIAIHRKTYPHCRLRAIASNRPQLLGLGLVTVSCTHPHSFHAVHGWLVTQLHTLPAAIESNATTLARYTWFADSVRKGVR